MFQPAAKEGYNSGFEPEIDAKWNWISMIDRLTGGDITKQNDVYELPWIQCLNTLAWWKTKDDYIERINKMNRLKNGK